MKIAILTQPLGHNYGGLLQAYALQKFLKEQGHNVITIDRRRPTPKGVRAIKQTIKKYIRFLKKETVSIPTSKKDNFVFKNLHLFRDKNIRLTRKITSTNELKEHFLSSEYDLVVVGSDQVWRPMYSPCIEDYFLDFIGDLSKKPAIISYAASFGVDNWEFSNSQTKYFSGLVKQFNGVSLREESGRELCKRHLNIDGVWVLDPTFLLKKNHYEQYFRLRFDLSTDNYTLSYVLDSEEEKQKIAESVAKNLSNKVYSIKPEDYTQKKSKHLSECLLPSVENWLQSFYSAEFVITDSFHGCVFCIIFNKQFIAIGNKERGLARFETLLSKFELEDRLILSSSELATGHIYNPIDWENVNRLRELHLKKSEEFLNHFL